MSKAPSMPMYWDAYLADTTHLTTEEHGAYMLLLGAMWRRDGWVPDDDKDNARILRLTPAKWKRIKERLSEFLLFADGKVSQKKLLETWENTQEKITTNRQNGAKGGRPKSSKNKGLDKPNGFENNNPIETIPEPEPEPLKKDTSNEVSVKAPIDDVSDAVHFWNEVAAKNDWPEVQKMTPARRAAVLGRLKDVGGVEGWRSAVERADASHFLTGQTPAAFRCSFDWLIKAANFTKLMEGNYDNRIGNNRSPAGSGAARSGPADALIHGFAASTVHY